MMTAEETGGKAAIRVTDAYKSFGESTILSGLSMNVPQATIYGLLGPSGCGKTTLLNCIVGRSKLDSGDIFVYIKSKSKMGYMPQDLALFTQLTIEETLVYFGTVYGLTRKEAQKRTDELVETLELPSKKKPIEILSGGQQRRVSLCVALLHNPDLLILDEPTVGVDPLLSHNIWKILIRMCNIEKKTIVITTHYIEEARQAQTIGLLRNGLLLAEEEPNKLMEIYHAESLEKVFLQLSEKQSINNNFTRNYHVPTFIDNFRFEKKKKKSYSILQEGRSLHWCRIKAQLMHGQYWMTHNISVMMFLLLLPIVQSALFCMTVGLDPLGLKIGIVNKELAPGQDCPSYFPSHCSYDQLSCRYFDVLKKDKSMKLIYYESDSRAKEGVQSNEVWGYVQVPNNYTPNLLDRIGLTIDSPDEALDQSELHVWMDMSNQYIGNLLRRDLIFGYIEFLKKLYTDCGWPASAAGVPINYQDAVYGDNKPSFAHFAVPAVVQLFGFYLPMMFSVGAILMEKRDGVLERSLVTGITLWESLIAHIMIQMVVLTVQLLSTMFVVFVMFDNPMKGSLLLCLSLLFLIGINGMSYGFLVSTLCDQDNAALYMGLGSFFPLAMLSGMVWPFEGMHWSLRSIGLFLPLTYTTESFRAIMSKAWPITHPTVYTGFFSALGWIIFFNLATFVIMKCQNGIKGNLKIPIISQVIRRKY